MNPDTVMIICIFILVFGCYMLGKMAQQEKEIDKALADEAEHIFCEACRKHGLESPEAIEAARLLDAVRR